MRASGAGRSGRVLRRLAVAALVAGIPVAAPVSVPGLGAAPAAAASSWDTNRTEEFTRGSLPKGCQPYGGPYEGGKSYWTKESVRLAGGLLRLKLQKRDGATGYPYASGGVGCWDWAQQYGRFEVRARVPQGRGIDSYITLMPSKGGEQNWTGVELLAPGPETAYITNGFGTGTETTRVPGTYSDGFHTFVIEWTPNLVRISVDNSVIYSSTKSYKGKRWLGMVVSNGDALTGVPDATTKLPAEFQIDYVRTATFTGVAPPAPKPTAKPAASAPSAATAPAAAGAAGALKAPATTPPAALAGAAASADDDSALAGGVWPWLLGGSMIAGLAVISLSYPRSRRNADSTKQSGQQRRRGMRRQPATASDTADDTTDDVLDPDDAGDGARQGPADAGDDLVPGSGADDPGRPRQPVR
jgi:beta-glucanase (GH16 family)